MIWRIRGRQAFRRLLRDGTRVRATTLWCTVLLDSQATPPRVAFSIGRALGPSTVRNRLRRRLRAVLREVDLPAGWWLFGIRTTGTEPTLAQLRGDVATLIEAAGSRSR